jgi:hypothetical protein
MLPKKLGPHSPLVEVYPDVIDGALRVAYVYNANLTGEVYFDDRVTSDTTCKI